MTQDSPKWLNALASTQATDMPEQVVEALRTRRQQRRRVLVAGWGSGVVALAVVSAAWISTWRGPGPALPIAEAPITPSHQDLVMGDQSMVTIAAVYGSTGMPDVERLGAVSAGGEVQQFRIGDHWDPDKVEAWVLE